MDSSYRFIFLHLSMVVSVYFHLEKFFNKQPWNQKSNWVKGDRQVHRIPRALYLGLCVSATLSDFSEDKEV